MNSKAFVAELRRRNVFKVAIAYTVIAWLLVETALVLLEGSEARASIIFVLLIIFVIGFALAMYISWAFEATPEGMKRTENVPAEVAATLPSWSPRKFAVFIIGTALLATGLMVLDLHRGRSKPASAPSYSPPSGPP